MCVVINDGVCMITKIVPNLRHYMRLVQITSVSLVAVVVLVLGLPYESYTSIPLPSTVIVEPKLPVVVSKSEQTSEIKQPVVKQETKPTKSKIKVYTHKGGKPISPTNLKTTITAVAGKITSIPNDHPQLTKLIYETANVESTFGKNIYSSGGMGVMQITQSTAKWYLETTKKNNRKTYNELMVLYDKDKSLQDNLLYNVPFSVGMSMVIYWQRAKSEVLSANNIEARARIWKKHYNTHKGKGTVKGYIAKNA